MFTLGAPIEGKGVVKLALQFQFNILKEKR